jgi:quinol monooxygenase YgiN
MAKQLRAVLDGMVVPSRAEQGNLQYDLWRDHADAGRFVLEEIYTDATAVAAHRATPHFEKYSSQINNLADRTFMILDPLEVA